MAGEILGHEVRCSSPPEALPDLLEAQRPELIAAWRTRVLSDPAVPEAQRLSRPELEDHVPDFVSALVASLRAEASGNRPSLASGPPRQHGRQRASQRYTLDAVMREWAHFRRALIELVDVHDVVPSARQRTLVHAAIDECMANAATEMQALALQRIEESLGEERKLSHRLQDEVSVREQFLAVLGHDLRNPLSAIVMGATELMKRQDAPRVRIAQRVVASAGRMASMIDDLLDLTRIRLGDGLSLVAERLDLCDVCRRVTEEFEMSDPDRTVALACAESVIGNFDKQRISRAVSNLVKNAIVHGAESSPITVEVREVDRVGEIEVGNEGGAIAPEVCATMFRPFARGARCSGEGLGLGLYIVREIALAHGGDVAWQSERGKTSFTLRLPLAPRE